ncbi:MAG: helix-turn-helix domain-containing protein [Prevotellaceae bacterium]|nr:helix-turn-helix domain-containing protein [Prevotellaceae bacterium]
MMEVITIETQAYKDLMAKINAIAKFVIASQTKETEETNDSWIDSYEVCTFLKISSRTLQRLRAARQINYSQIRGKNFYKISEIQRLLNEHVIRSSDNCLQDLVKNHKLYVEQRRDIKKNK